MMPTRHQQAPPASQQPHPQPLQQPQFPTAAASATVVPAALPPSPLPSPNIASPIHPHHQLYHHQHPSRPPRFSLAAAFGGRRSPDPPSAAGSANNVSVSTPTASPPALHHQRQDGFHAAVVVSPQSNHSNQHRYTRSQQLQSEGDLYLGAPSPHVRHRSVGGQHPDPAYPRQAIQAYLQPPTSTASYSHFAQPLAVPQAKPYAPGDSESLYSPPLSSSISSFRRLPSTSPGNAAAIPSSDLASSSLPSVHMRPINGPSMHEDSRSPPGPRPAGDSSSPTPPSSTAMTRSNSRRPSGASEAKETRSLVKNVDPATGSKMINKYMILKEIGRGVHGKVKLCVDTETGELFAIKIVDKRAKKRFQGRSLSLRTADSEEPSNPHLEKIRREIAILKKVDHPNVVILREVIDDPHVEKIYLADEARHIFRDVICGLQYHKVVKISDFGVSVFVGTDDDENDPSSTSYALELAKTAGSPAFFAPELCAIVDDGTENAQNADQNDEGNPRTFAAGVKMARSPSSPIARRLIEPPIRRKSAPASEITGGIFVADYANNPMPSNPGIVKGSAPVPAEPSVAAPPPLAVSGRKSPALLSQSGRKSPALSLRKPSSKTDSSDKGQPKPVDQAVPLAPPSLAKGRAVSSPGVTYSSTNLPAPSVRPTLSVSMANDSNPLLSTTRDKAMEVGAAIDMLDFPESPPIDISLRDLLSRLLEKDPDNRMTLLEAKQHIWTTSDFTPAERSMWFAETDPDLQFGIPFSVTDEEVSKAVHGIDKLLDGFRRFGHGLQKVVDGGEDSAAGSGTSQTRENSRKYNDSPDPARTTTAARRPSWAGSRKRSADRPPNEPLSPLHPTSPTPPPVPRTLSTPTPTPAATHARAAGAGSSQRGLNSAAAFAPAAAILSPQPPPATSAAAAEEEAVVLTGSGEGLYGVLAAVGGDGPVSHAAAVSVDGDSAEEKIRRRVIDRIVGKKRILAADGRSGGGGPHGHVARARSATPDMSRRRAAGQTD
ncbi:hypothetical protein HK405_010905 [Cladochytrium tenue]|nr:hypothetical protein HK405_010905 [Cladochytrium tenue]